MSAAAGEVAVITGSGGGIGRVLATRYAAAGYDVVLAGRRESPLRETAALVTGLGRAAEVVVADVRSEDDCVRLVAAAVERFDRLDVLLNNAAVPGRDQPVAEMDLANWTDTLTTNLTGPMLLSREVLRQAMLAAGRGNIQFFSSAAAKSIVARKAHYNAAKLALLPLARTLAQEVGRQGIRVNTLVIGTVEGELVEGYVRRVAGERGVDADVVRDELAGGAALGRLVQPDEVADVSLWLASDAASAITGQDINVSAGGEKR